MKSCLIPISMACIVIFGSVKALAEPMYGILMVVKGSVKVTNPQNQTSDAKVGGKVMEGDKIVTGADSRAKVVMSDRNVLNVSPETEVVISKYENDATSGKKNVELNLLKGKVRNNVEQTYDGEKNKFLIKTPTAVAGVRGTQFLAGFDVKTKMTSVVTFKGSVTLASVNPQGRIIGAPVLVKKGQMTQAAPDMVPEPPKVIPKEEIKNMDAESSTGNASTNKGSEPAREVAAEGTAPVAGETAPPPSMVDSRDLDVGMSTEISKSPLAPPPPPTTVMTPPPQITPPPAVNSAIQNSNTKTKVNVRPVPQN